MSTYMEGYSLEDLLAIGTRKKGVTLHMSATDINSPISGAESLAAQQMLGGFSENELKEVAQRKIGISAPSPHEINEPSVSRDMPAAVSETLDRLQKFLGIRTS